MRSLRIVPFALVVGFGAATCTNHDQLAGQALDDQLAQAFCAHEFACCAPAEIAEMAAGRYLTQTECLPYATLAAKTQLALLENAVAAGHITVDDDAAQSCLASYAGGACNTAVGTMTPVLPYPTASVLAGCPGLLVGQLPAGAVCTLTEECAAGTRCTAGTSVFATGAGGAFGSTGFAGTFGTSAPATGAPGVCVALQQLGQPCNQTSDCDPEAHLSCNTLDFTCAAPAGPGAACGFDSFGNPTVICDPTQGLHCDPASLSCRRDPGPNEPCNFSLPTGCSPDPTLSLSCNAFTDLCVSPGGPGDACGGSALAPCRWDLGCVPTQADGIGTCQPAPAVGEACRGPCQSPAVCDGAVCRAIGALPAGAPCSTSDDCATLICEPVAGQSGLFCVSLGRPVRCAGSSVTPAFGGVMTGFGGTVGTGGAGGVAGSGGAGIGGPAGAPGTSPTGAGATSGGRGGTGGMTGIDAGPLPPRSDSGIPVTGAAASGPPPADGGGGITGGTTGSGASGPPLPTDGGGDITGSGTGAPPPPEDGGGGMSGA
jgi:hypothetical protein